MTTGGPEAVHQLSHMLNKLGFDSGIGYFQFRALLVQHAGDRMVFHPPASNPCLTLYEQYHPVVRREIPLGPDHLIILPEVINQHVDAFRPASVGVWWLSVDNAYEHNPQLRDDATRRAYFAREDILHFHQSAYAREFLRSQGLPWSYPLGDYTTDRFTALPARRPPAGRRVMYNPAKGGRLAEAFFAKHPDIEPLPIKGMTAPEIADHFGGNLVFIDFGHFPGKDRMPREAAAAGAIVFVRRRGAGRFFEDFPLPDLFKFEEAHIESGELHRRVQAVTAEPHRFWPLQEPFRADIRWEKTAFRDQLRKLLGQPADL